MSGIDRHDAVIVRDARDEDFSAIGDLVSGVYDEFAQHFPAAIWNAYRREISDVESRRGISDLVVAVRGSTLLGTVTFYPSARADGHGWPDWVSSFRLLAVPQRARGAGVGHLLVQDCLDRALRCGVEVLGLHTAPFMTAAISLYESMGFTRAREYDFEAHHIYGGSAEGTVAGLAYVLPVHAAQAAGEEMSQQQ